MRCSRVWMRCSRVCMRFSRLWMKSSRVWMRCCWVCMRFSRVWMRCSRVWIRCSRVRMRCSRLWMRCSRVARASGSQCWSTVATFLGLIPASSDTYIKKSKKIPLLCLVQIILFSFWQRTNISVPSISKSQRLILGTFAEPIYTKNRKICLNAPLKPFKDN